MRKNHQSQRIGFITTVARDDIPKPVSPDLFCLTPEFAQHDVSDSVFVS